MISITKKVVLAIEKYLRTQAWAPWIWGASVFMLLATMSVELWARAGGGGNYSGGGGSSGGGGGGGGEAIVWLVYLAIRHPQIGVPILIVVIVGGVVKNRLNPDNTTARAIKSLSQMAAPDTSGLGDIQQRDPSFSTDSFLSWVHEIDDLVQDAWSRGDMSPVRNYLSDGLYRRFATQLSVMKAQNVQNPVADHEIVKCVIHAVEHDVHFDTIHVVIEAKARDTEVDAALSYDEAIAKAKRASLEKYTEIWSFLRKPGAVTLDDKGFAEGTCPNCGASLDNAQSTKCEYCDALVNSGDYDWVLAEITQSIEWRPASTGTVSGLMELQQKDSEFNRQVAEDRASYVFWRWLEAMVTGSKAPLAKCATPQLQQEVLDKAPLTHFKAAVGSVDLVQIEVGANADGSAARDKYVAKILWSSAATPKSAPVHRANVFVFGRDQAPQKDGGLSFAHCAECLGPLSENDSNTCEYCGAALASGKVDWVLENVMLPYELQASRRMSSSPSTQQSGGQEDTQIPSWAMPDMASRQERALLLMNMAAVVMADGIVTRQERKLLKAASKRWDVPMAMVEPILAGQMDAESISELRPANPNSFVDGLIGAALIDGRIDSSEQKLLLDVAANLGLQEATVRNRMNTMAKMAKVSQAG